MKPARLTKAKVASTGRPGKSLDAADLSHNAGCDTINILLHAPHMVKLQLCATEGEGSEQCSQAGPHRIDVNITKINGRSISKSAEHRVASTLNAGVRFAGQ